MFEKLDVLSEGLEVSLGAYEHESLSWLDLIHG
jgi:hypothetical protein